MRQALIDFAEILLPAGKGPFPVVVQMHGCGGVQPMQRRYAEAALEAGVAVVILDSLKPRYLGRREAQFTV
jgi:dienelactone hydrolase